jgi:hypothetical protein
MYCDWGRALSSGFSARMRCTVDMTASIFVPYALPALRPPAALDVDGPASSMSSSSSCSGAIVTCVTCFGFRCTVQRGHRNCAILRSLLWQCLHHWWPQGPIMQSDTRTSPHTGHSSSSSTASSCGCAAAAAVATWAGAALANGCGVASAGCACAAQSHMVITESGCAGAAAGDAVADFSVTSS